VKAAKVTKN